MAATFAKGVWAGEAITRGPPDVVAEDDVVSEQSRVVGAVEAGAKRGPRPDRVKVVAGVADLAVLDKRVLAVLPGRMQVNCRRTPIGVIRCRSSLRSARTVLENAIVITVFTVVVTGVPYTSEVVQ